MIDLAPERCAGLTRLDDHQHAMHAIQTGRLDRQALTIELHSQSLGSLSSHIRMCEEADHVFDARLADLTAELERLRRRIAELERRQP
jgi:hypothetical protein